jgi:acid phosphatase family membrane protein YuiD
MEIWKHVNGTGLEVILSLLLANWIAQIIKTLRFFYKRREINFSIMFATGGMPSSHSSTVTAMATSIGFIDGFGSTTFAVSCCIAGIVMYDAAGLRRSASKQAMVLNQIIKELFSADHKLSREKLKEFLGHTRKEVLAGALLGIAVAMLIRYLFLMY